MRLFFLTLLFLFAGIAQGQRLAFNQLTVKDGLSQNSVLTIKQDGDGFMWFGTRYGLNRYDGSHFKIYTFNQNDTNSLFGNYVRCLLLDRKKNLWAGTSEGLKCYDPILDRFFDIKLPSKHEVVIKSIYQNRKGYLFIGTSQGLYVIEEKSGRAIAAAKLGLNPVWMNMEILCTYEDTKGNTWIAAGNKLLKCRFNGRFTQFKSFEHIEGKNETLSNSSINHILEDKQGKLWFATESKGLNLLEADGESFRHFYHHDNIPNSLAHNAIRDMIIDREGRILIGTQEGLSIFDPQTETFQNNRQVPMLSGSLSNNSIYSIYQDSIGSIWIGTYHKGININYAYQTDFHYWKNTNENSGLNNDIVSSVAADRAGNLWIGTEGGGLNLFNREKNKFTYFQVLENQKDGLGSNFIKTVYVNHNQNIWVGTTGAGLNLLDKSRGRAKKFLTSESFYQANRMEIRSIMEDSQQCFWVGGMTSGIFKRDGANLTEHPISKRLKAMIGGTYVIHIHEDKRKRIWLMSEDHIYICAPDLSKSIMLSYRSIKGLYGIFNCIQEDYQGNMWI